jgi:hypothetical protein
VFYHRVIMIVTLPDLLHRVVLPYTGPPRPATLLTAIAEIHHRITSPTSASLALTNSFTGADVQPEIRPLHTTILLTPSLIPRTSGLSLSLSALGRRERVVLTRRGTSTEVVRSRVARPGLVVACTASITRSYG